MRNEGIPINKDIVAWARKRAGLSLAEAAEKFAHIEDWETGTVLPTYPQLESMAEEFKVPIAVFFFPEPPKLPPIRESFRTLPDTEFESIPRRIVMLLRKAKAFQLNLAELCQDKNPAPRQITQDLEFTPRTSIETITARVREYLGITLEQQAAWPDDDEALKAWRNVLQKVGIFVFKDAFKDENYSGFSLYDDVFPIIYANNSSTKTRQIFTLFHELGHLLFHTSGIDTLNGSYIDDLPERQKRIEILCNRFAAEFLVPQAAFNEAYAGLEPTEQTAEILATQFHVSREFIFRKLLDLGEITQATYLRASKEWAEQRHAKPGGDHYWSKLAYLGREYVALAFRQYHQNRIDDVQLGEYLDTKPKNLATLEEYFAKSVS